MPISSSGHLVLVPVFFGWTDQGLTFDVAVHFGSLAAVAIYFRNDLKGLIVGGTRLLGGNSSSPESRMALFIIIGTIPAAIAGLSFAGWIEANLRSPFVIVFTLSGYGLLMALADRFGKHERVIASVGLKDAGKIFPGHGGVLDRFDSLLPGSVFFAMAYWILST